MSTKDRRGKKIAHSTRHQRRKGLGTDRRSGERRVELTQKDANYLGVRMRRSGTDRRNEPQREDKS